MVEIVARQRRVASGTLLRIVGRVIQDDGCEWITWGVVTCKLNGTPKDV